MTKKIFTSISLVAILSIITGLLVSSAILYEYFSKLEEDRLKKQTMLIGQIIEDEDNFKFDKLDKLDFRVSLIDKEGKVIYDNRKDLKGLENHSDRKEIIKAFKEGYGLEKRYSKTMTENYIYSAYKIKDDRVVRLSQTQYSVITLLLASLQPIIAISILIIILSLFLAYKLAKKIVKPLNEFEPGKEIKESYRELEPLIKRLDKQQMEIRAKEDALLRKEKEFDSITSGLEEGLVLLNHENKIVAINKASKKIFSVGENILGKDILFLNRDILFTELIKKSDQEKKISHYYKIGGKTYQLNIYKIFDGKEVMGKVIAFFDVSEKKENEDRRREFTANVSHELKTPLQTIYGASELLKNNLIKEEDKKEFIGQIYKSSERLIQLVEDIIELSKLDEGQGEIYKEEIDLKSLCLSVIDSLSLKAKNRAIKVEFEGQEIKVMANSKLLYAIIYNLLDNAIKYNKDKGRASIRIYQDKDYFFIETEDTGIGLENQDKDRIFERFYRVDKARSDKTQGTGLGLSIVKNIVKMYQGKIYLESKLDSGTKIKVKLKKQI